MKKLFSTILVICSLLGGNASISEGATRDYKELAKIELYKCVKNGRWICEQIKIDEVVNKYKKNGSAKINKKNNNLKRTLRKTSKRKKI